MSTRKMSTIAIISSFCLFCVLNAFAQAQDEDQKSDDQSSSQVTVTTTAAAPAPAATPSSTGAAIVVPKVPQIQERRIVESQQLRKAEEEMQKVRMQLDQTLKELAKSGNQAAVQKAREEMQKAMQKAEEEMRKAKAQYDKTVKEFGTRQVLPGAGFDPFSAGGTSGATFSRSTGGGYGGAIGGGYGGKIIMDNRTGQMIVKGPNSLQIITDPEAKELREKEEKIVADIGDIENQYRASKDKDERAKLKNKLTEMVGEQFGIRQQYREMQVKRLEKELAQIRDSIQKRSENREQIIKRHIAQLLGEQDDLEF